MSTKENKKRISEFLVRFSTNDLDSVLDMLDDEATWWIAGKPELQPAAGIHSKEQIAGVFRRMSSQLKNGLSMTVKGMIAEGDKVSVEIEGYGELLDGRVYNNEYHMVITIREGKISAVREYLDTQHVFATWFSG